MTRKELEKKVLEVVAAAMEENLEEATEEIENASDAELMQYIQETEEHETFIEKEREGKAMTTIKNIQTGETITREFTEAQLAECKRDGFEVVKEVKIHGLKRAVGEYQRYNDRFRFWSTLMYDTSDGEIWCDTFPDGNSWKEYHSDTIHRIDRDVEMTFGRVAMDTVKRYIKETF